VHHGKTELDRSHDYKKFNNGSGSPTAAFLSFRGLVVALAPGGADSSFWNPPADAPPPTQEPALKCPAFEIHHELQTTYVQVYRTWVTLCWRLKQSASDTVYDYRGTNRPNGVSSHHYAVAYTWGMPVTKCKHLHDRDVIRLCRDTHESRGQRHHS